MSTFPESVTRSTELLGLTRSVVKRMLRAMNPNSTELHDKLQPKFQQVLQRFFDARAHEPAAVDAVIPGAKAEIRALQNADEARDFLGALAALRDTIMGAWQVDFDLRASLLPTGLILLTSMTMLLAACAASDGSNPLMVPTLNVPNETATPEISPTADQLIDVTPTPSPEATTAPTDQWLTPTELTPEATQPITATATMTETVTPTSTATPTATSTPEFTPTPSVPMAVPSSNINVRQGPGTNYDVVNRAATAQQLLITGKIQIGTELWLQVADEAEKAIGFVRSDVVGVEGSLDSVPNLSPESVPPTPTREPTATPRPATPTPADAQPPPTDSRPVETAPASGGWMESLFNGGPGPYKIEILEGGVGSHSRGIETFMIKRVVTAEARQWEDYNAIRVMFDDNTRALLYLRGTPNTTTSGTRSPINGFCIEDTASHVCILDPSIAAHGDIAQYVALVASALRGQVIGFNNPAGEGSVPGATYVIVSGALGSMLRGL